MRAISHPVAISSPQSPQSPGSPASLLCSPPRGQGINSPESDDTMSVASSVASSASALGRAQFIIPATWRPSVMACINAATEEDQRRLLTTAIRNEIVRDLVTQMYACNPRPDRAFCTVAARSLVKKYHFMKDVGTNVSGYVSQKS